MSRITLTILITGLTLAACNEATERRTQDAVSTSAEVGLRDAASQVASLLGRRLEGKTDR